jgi:hypothetical protein
MIEVGWRKITMGSAMKCAAKAFAVVAVVLAVWSAVDWYRSTLVVIPTTSGAPKDTDTGLVDMTNLAN